MKGDEGRVLDKTVRFGEAFRFWVKLGFTNFGGTKYVVDARRGLCGGSPPDVTCSDLRK